jgi:uncharacterized YccA/Bax inhibitor family protein
MSSKNPIFSSSVIENAPMAVGAPMTVQGAVHKSGILLALVSMGAAFSWNRASHGGVELLILIGLVVGCISALVTCFKKEWSAVTAPVYALFEGLLLGGISAKLNAAYPGIALQACMLTFGTLFGLLGAYRMGWIRASEQFKAIVIAGTMAIGVVYLVSMVVNLFGAQVPFIHDSGQVGILFSVAVVVIAAMNLILDFDFMEQAAAARAPKYMEWYSAFGLMVSLIWLYMEILKLLVKLARRR